MSISESDATFDGSIPKLYEMYFVPMVFVHCADELVKRLSGRKLSNVLEIAAGTGVVTRAMTSILPECVSIIATDLNEPMLEQAKFVGTKRPVEWRQADAMSLPFSDEMFDAVICQCGVMFFPDKAKAFAEVRRVLRPGRFIAFEVGEVRGGTVRLEDLVLPAAMAAGLDPRLVVVNAQQFTKTANCWGVDNNSKGTNTNRIVLLRKPAG